MMYQELLSEIVNSDERFVVMTAENRASIRKLADAGGPRFIDTGIAEQALVGAAAGLALRGRVPVVHALSAFLTMRAFEFIRTDVGIPGLPVKLCGSVAGFLSTANGPTHQAVEDVALMRAVPNVGIFCPADEEDLLIGLHEVLNSPQPFYIRLNHEKSVIRHSSDFTIGKAEVVSEGEDVAILVYGMLFSNAWEAKNILEASGRSVRLVNLRTLKPIDEEVLLRAVRETGVVVTLEDHFMTGGLFSLVSEFLARRGLRCALRPLALEDRWFKPSLLPHVLEYEGFTGRHIAEKIANYLDGEYHAK